MIAESANVSEGSTEGPHPSASSPAPRLGQRNRAVTSEGYVRVRPTWRGRRLQQMNGAGFGRIVGWLLGAFAGVLIMLAISRELSPLVLVLGIALSSALGCVVGHFLGTRIWRMIRPEIDALNPREVPAEDLRAGQWVMAINDGTERAIEVRGTPERVTDPLAAVSDQPVDTVAIPVSTGRPIIVPAGFRLTVIDLATPVDPREPA